MIPSQVRCVLFDAVGTLIHAVPPVRAVYAAAGRDFGQVVDEATIEKRFASALCSAFVDSGDREPTSETIERRRWRAIVAEVFPEVRQIDLLFEQLWGHFARPESWRLYDDVVDCWQSLTEQGLSLGVASNFDQRLLRICRGLPPLDRCELVFFSSQIGFRKPAVPFFRAVEQAVKLAPQQLLLAGDDWEADYLAATAAGWHAVHLDRSGNCPAAGAIRSLSELGGTARG